MKKRKYGKIVNIGSIWGIVSKRGRVVYTATKHGIHGITKTLAVELGEYNICVNTVCSGFTLTELTKKTILLSRLKKSRVKFLSTEWQNQMKLRVQSVIWLAKKILM